MNGGCGGGAGGQGSSRKGEDGRNGGGTSLQLGGDLGDGRLPAAAATAKGLGYHSS